VSNEPYTYTSISVNIFDFGQKAAFDSFQKYGTEIGQKQLKQFVELDNGIVNGVCTNNIKGVREEESLAKEMADKFQLESARKSGKR
jgi:hypothetical protein